MAFVWKSFQANHAEWNVFGHGFYAHLYAAQAFYQAGDEYWDNHSQDPRPPARHAAGGRLVDGDGIGPVFGTAVALTVLQLPYRFLPSPPAVRIQTRAKMEDEDGRRRKRRATAGLSLPPLFRPPSSIRVWPQHRESREPQ